MTDPFVVRETVHFTGGSGRSRKRLHPGPAADAPVPGRVPRVARLMALAIRFDGLIRQGVVRDQTDLARLGHVSTPRVTQILNLLNLAPDLQERILFLPPVTAGRDPITERQLRPLLRELDWAEQRRRWATHSVAKA